MKHTIEDERTRGLKRQVRGEAYLLTAALLLVSLFWKTYGLGLPVTACLTELVVLLVGVVYLAVRSTLVSYELVDPSKAGRRLRALAVVAISAVVAVANAVRNWNTYGDRYTGLLDGHFLAVPVVTFPSCRVCVVRRARFRHFVLPDSDLLCRMEPGDRGDALPSEVRCRLLHSDACLAEAVFSLE